MTHFILLEPTIQSDIILGKGKKYFHFSVNFMLNTAIRKDQVFVEVWTNFGQEDNAWYAIQLDNLVGTGSKCDDGIFQSNTLYTVFAKFKTSTVAGTYQYTIRAKTLDQSSDWTWYSQFINSNSHSESPNLNIIVQPKTSKTNRWSKSKSREYKNTKSKFVPVVVSEV
jgi:hypothetical protein